MNDAMLARLLDAMDDAPRLVLGRYKFVHVGWAVVCMTRKGKGERWEFRPSSDVKPTPGELPFWWPREARRWVERAPGFDVAAHARAMGRRLDAAELSAGWPVARP